LAVIPTAQPDFSVQPTRVKQRLALFLLPINAVEPKRASAPNAAITV
jgi:hypothetical protein